MQPSQPNLLRHILISPAVVGVTMAFVLVLNHGGDIGLFSFHFMLLLAFAFLLLPPVVSILLAIPMFLLARLNFEVPVTTGVIQVVIEAAQIALAAGLTYAVFKFVFP